MDWHFVAFRARNAEHVAAVTVDVLGRLVERMPEARSTEVREHATAASDSLKEVQEYTAEAHLRLNDPPQAESME